MEKFEWREIVCPVCDVDDTSIVGWRGGRAHRATRGELCRIVQCRRCSLLYANPFPFPRSLDDLYSATDDYFVHHGTFESKTEFRQQWVAKIEEVWGGTGRLLDVGAGLGETVAAALTRGWDAYGIEPSASFAAEGARRTDGRVIHGEVGQAPEEIMREPFDAVVLAGVLEHLHDPRTVLEWISHRLRPGGVLYIDVPNEKGLYFTIANFYLRASGRDWCANLAPTFEPFHVFGFSRQSLTLMLQRFQLVPERMNFYAGRSLLPFQPSVRGLVEWASSHVIHLVTKGGSMGTYIECIARKLSS